MQSSRTAGFIIDPAVEVEPGQPGEAETASRRTGNRGEPRNCQSAPPKDRSARANWRQEHRRSQRSKKIRGDPEILSGEAGGWISQGDLAGSSSGAGGRRCGATRTLVFGDTERTRYGATRKRSVGAAEGRTLRIASKVRRRQKAGTRRMRGDPGSGRKAQREA